MGDDELTEAVFNETWAVASRAIAGSLFSLRSGKTVFKPNRGYRL